MNLSLVVRGRKSTYSMSNADEAALKEYADAGVDLPELQEEAKEETKVEPEPTPQPEEAKEEDAPAPEAPKEPLKEEPKEERKPRSIYDEYKDKKTEARAFQNLAVEALKAQGVDVTGTETAEELTEKFKSLGDAKTPQQKKEAQDDIDAFAQEIGADPVAIRKMRDLFLSNAPKSELDPDLVKRLERFEAWEADNAKVVEESMFNKEFEAITPTLKEMFPTASDEEMKAIKSALDEVSHTEEYHDKELDYVAFKEKEKLSALVSPRKRGMESQGRKDIDESSFEFDPNADLTKMTIAERELWEEKYKQMGKTEGVLKDGQGRKLLV